MHFLSRLFLVSLLSVSGISCRSIDSNTVPTIIDADHPSNITLVDHITSTSEPTPRSFEICEYFDEGESSAVKLRGKGITVVMKLFWQLWSRQVLLLSKLQARFHNAGHLKVHFVIITKNQTHAERIHNTTHQLEVILVNGTQVSQIANLEDRSIYIFDNCGRIVYVIHYPYSSIQKPFVKAAVLSTIYDAPCGYCPTNVQTPLILIRQFSLIYRIFIGRFWWWRR